MPSFNNTNRRTLHECVMREAASSGQLKRYCKTCGVWVEDQDFTKSKFCSQHRRKNKQSADRNNEAVQPSIRAFTVKQKEWMKAFEALTGMEAQYQEEFLGGKCSFEEFVDNNRQYICDIAALIPRAPIEDEDHNG